jgi:DNA (cytosine-5)-methyltransferase 1
MDLKARQKEILKEEYRNGEWYSADVRLIRGDNVPRADCWCFGAPCQDFSVAGQRKGLDGDRSSLVREVFRVLGELEEEHRPEWLIYENVKGMLSSNRGWDFLAIILEMEQLGYDVEWELFNTKNFGVPQNRERVYTVGHLRSRGERKIFPLKGADGENSVSVEIMGHRDGYRRNMQVFAPEGVTEALSTCQGGGREHHVGVPVLCSKNRGIRCGAETAPTLLSRDYKGLANRNEKTCVVILVLTPDRPVKRQNGRRFKDNGDESFTLTAQDRHGVGVEVEPQGVLRTVRTEYGKAIRKDYEEGRLKISRHKMTEYEIRNDGITNTIDSVQKDNLLTVKIKEATKQGYAIAHEGDSINLSIPGSKTRRGRVGNGVANTLDCKCEQGVFVKLSDNLTVYAVWYEKYQCYIAIRKLTPRECFRLQGWTDDYFEKAAFVNSDSQLYKQAGNGVTVNVVQTIGEAIKED